MKQLHFEKTNWTHRYCHGGVLRKQRLGRRQRPLSTKEPIHLVFKARKDIIKGGLRTYQRYFLISKLTQKYSKKFFIKIEQVSIQNDHIHLLIRISRRSQGQNFLRVLAGQIAQKLQHKKLMKVVTDTPAGPRVEGKPGAKGERKAERNIEENGVKGLWKCRPFTRVVKGWKAYQLVKDYIQLNEKEALGEIAYRKERLRGLSAKEWDTLWI